MIICLVIHIKINSKKLCKCILADFKQLLLQFINNDIPTLISSV